MMMSKSNGKQDNVSGKRSQVIIKSGWLFILVNFLLAFFNLLVGILSNSLAIASDAVHSLIDAISGVLIIVSEKLASKSRFAERREKIERITTIAIAIIIILVGLEMLIASFKNIITPGEVDFSVPTIIILVASIATKWFFAVYLKKKAAQFKSDVLKASGAETMNDAWISIAVLLSVIIYLIWHVNVESYISIVIAFVVIKIGFEFIFPHLSQHHHHPFDSNPDHDHCGKDISKK